MVNLENHGKPGELGETLRTRVTKENKGRTREEPGEKGENRKTRGIQQNGGKSEIRSSRGNMENQGKYGNQ